MSRLFTDEDADSPARSLVRREAEEARCVLGRDLALNVLGGAGEDASEELPGLRPRGLGVGEIASPEHVVDTDHVTELDAEIVLHELDEHVAAPVVARQESLLRPPP